MEQEEYQTTTKLQRHTICQSRNTQSTGNKNDKTVKEQNKTKPGAFTSTIKNLFFSFCIEVSACLHTM